MRDSSGYSIPHTADRLDLIYTLSAKNDIKSHRIEAYIQDTYHFSKGDNFFTLNYGVRLANWSFNKETIVSPRAHWPLCPPSTTTSPSASPQDCIIRPPSIKRCATR